MGTNYYYHTQVNVMERLLGKEPEVLHIGKSSFGWCFSLHAIKERGLTSAGAWLKFIHEDGGKILNEYDEVVSLEELHRAICDRKGRNSEPPFRTIKSIKGDQFEYEEHESFEAYCRKIGGTAGPNGLVRHKVDGRHCLANGDGTWDLIAGEFS